MDAAKTERVERRGPPVREDRESRPPFVPRPRLTERLLSSPPAPVVLLCAPAGYSKTTCLSDWASRDRRRFAWVTANRRLNDPALLISSIIEAFEGTQPLDPEISTALTVPRPAISSVVLPRVGRALEQLDEPFVLVIDDLHLVTSRGSLEVIATLIDHLPRGSQLALASRTEPFLRLGRLRAHRRLVELGPADLRMTRGECAALLESLGLDLDPPQLDRVCARTEGWPAAIYLAGLALSREEDVAAGVESFAGDDRVVADYLREEFIAAMAPEARSFLTRISILDEVSGPLCDAVLETEGSAALLARLARSNALIAPLDRGGTVHRLHPLFAEMLLAELRLTAPREEPELHLRASRWYHSHADFDRAIEHAIAAADVDWVGELMLEGYPALSGRGRVATVERWLGQLGERQITGSPALCVSAAHMHLALGEGTQAEHYRLHTQALMEGPARAADGVEAHLLLLAATFAREGVAKMGRDAARASGLFPVTSPWQAPVYLYRGAAAHLTGDRLRALPLLRECARRGAVSSSIIQSLALSQLALLEAEDGDWPASSRLVAQAREQVRRCGLQDYPSIVLSHAVSALVRAHEGDVGRAREDAGIAFNLLDRFLDFAPWYQAETRIVLARCCLRLDDPEAARGLLEEASGLLQQAPDASTLLRWHRETHAAVESAQLEGRGGEARLTKAELRALQYLPSHLTFREIGEELHLSPNTVKTQARAIYRKLDASSRAEAVAEARKAGLLDADALVGT